MSNRTVTEEDFRMPEFRHAKPEDYEFRGDGKLVRKDRWETGIGSIRCLVGINGRSFEISEIVDAVRELVTKYDDWTELILTNYDTEDRPYEGEVVDVKLKNGSILRNVAYSRKNDSWTWTLSQSPNDVTVVFGDEDIAGWKVSHPELDPA